MPSDLRIFDAHTHAFPDHIAPAAMKSLVAEALWMPIRNWHDGTISGLLTSMDRAGIERAMMCGVATKPGQVGRITEWCASVATDRIVSFASIHPDFDCPEAEIDRIASLGLRGIKFHPQYMRCAIDDPRTIRIARAAARAGLAMCFHCGYDLGFPKDDLARPRRTRVLHEAVPNLRILACHLGGWECWDEVVEHLAGRPVYLETSFAIGPCPRPLLDRILELHPHDHILFGTDSPWADQLAEVAAFAKLGLPDKMMRGAMWDNVLRFLGISGEGY